MKRLNLELLLEEARDFSLRQSTHHEASLFGVTDGKAVGTYLEHKFRNALANKYEFKIGNSAAGIDFPDLNVDMKVTSSRQPQSSCPYKSARQKIYGLGYGVLVFIYEKLDDQQTKTSALTIVSTVFVEDTKTGDFQTTRGLRSLIENEANEEDLIAFMIERNLPVDDIEITNLAQEILKNKPEQGFLTISNALQWRLQYGRVIVEAGKKEGIHLVHRGVSEL
jgi:hypothetical protein